MSQPEDQTFIPSARQREQAERLAEERDEDDGTALCESCEARLPLDDLLMTVGGLLCDECVNERRCDDPEFRREENREISNPY